jgi:L,D-transpeptidase catalytic domain
MFAAGALLAGGCGGGGRSPSTGSTVSLQQHGHAVVRHVEQHRGESIVATAVKRSVPIYRSPSARRPFRRLSNPTSIGAPLVFLVASRGQGWEHVYLPIRPDGAKGWVRDRDVSLAWNPYSLVVRLGRHELVLRKNGRIAVRFPAGVGRSVLPTPTGRYYIVDLLKQPNPNGVYGPYAFGTSAFSRVLYHFGGGPGQIGIHGTDERASIGQSVSHGCIRLRNRDIVRLAHVLPLGTPITILD